MELPRLLLEMSALLTLAVLLGLVARRIKVPLSVALVVVGFLAAAVGLSPEMGRLEGEAFEEVVVFLFLPVLVFAAALGIDLRAFLRNLGAIVALAVVAFLLSAVVVGLTLHWVLGTALAAAFVFGALISATDPVAVVAVFREVGVPRRLLTLVEGESLLNDGVAIVLFAILVEAATGGSVSVAAGVLDFVVVFGGGAVIGIALGLAASAVLPWLGRLPAAGLSVATAYGSFVLADAVLGFSGVMATAAAGMVLAGLAPSRASAEVREMWEQLWEALDYVANALLFLIIGLVIGPEQLLDHLGPIALAAAVVLLARALAVVPLVWLLERVAHIPRLGWRNEAVLVWGGLRGGVALALALALPEELAERELLVALTGGVVLATLVLNATSIRWLVSRLGLDRPTRVDRYLMAIARVSAIEAARKEMDDLGLDPDPRTSADLESSEQAARQEMVDLHVEEGEEYRIVVGRGLHVERRTYQQLSDEGLLPAAVTRTLLHEVDDEIDDFSLHASSHRLGAARRAPSGRLERVSRRLAGLLPEPASDEPGELAYAEATARRLAARRTADALEIFDDLPAIRQETVDQARRTFADWEQRAVAELSELDTRSGEDARALRVRQVHSLAAAAASRELVELVETGLLPEQVLGSTGTAQADHPR
ncbi:cation:proton antiporter [Blastococcus sp. VKM Ac-2987]|uniref:cation:proton antiporter n=1 Tax=Blastococcus sp. VKM Ac-2987 TaxID=3004141 RepID=UPI0022ABB44E|nr:sodium:proton antiporter [Blastococcus sp. VKM Ac-2987]MCZ2860675.1 sodium:proton antiporter [Blastococcus sp. VKM Ac-2987]